MQVRRRGVRTSSYWSSFLASWCPSVSAVWSSSSISTATRTVTRLFNRRHIAFVNKPRKIPPLARTPDRLRCFLRNCQPPASNSSTSSAREGSGSCSSVNSSCTTVYPTSAWRHWGRTEASSWRTSSKTKWFCSPTYGIQTWWPSSVFVQHRCQTCQHVSRSLSLSLFLSFSLTAQLIAIIFLLRRFAIT